MKYQMVIKDDVGEVIIGDPTEMTPTDVDSFNNEQLQNFTSLSYLAFVVDGVTRYYNPKHLIYAYIVPVQNGVVNP